MENLDKHCLQWENICYNLENRTWNSFLKTNSSRLKKLDKFNVFMENHPQIDHIKSSFIDVV